MGDAGPGIGWRRGTLEVEINLPVTYHPSPDRKI